MVRYGLADSRLKDFFDLWALSREFQFDGATLGAAVRATFANRQRAVPADPSALSPAFAQMPDHAVQWRAFLRDGVGADVDEDLATVVEHLATFILPVVAALSHGDDFGGVWLPGGPWRPA